jgi:hypothetical protein
MPFRVRNIGNAAACRPATADTSTASQVSGRLAMGRLCCTSDGLPFVLICVTLVYWILSTARYTLTTICVGTAQVRHHVVNSTTRLDQSSIFNIVT